MLEVKPVQAFPLEPYVSSDNPHESGNSAAEQNKQEHREKRFRGPFKRERRVVWEWRHQRPFWAAMFGLFASVPILYFPYATLSFGQITVTMTTMSGAASAIIGCLLIMLAMVMLFQPQLRVFAGVATMICGFVSFVTSNFGGFLIGLICATIGGTLAVAWATDEDDEDDFDPEGKSSDGAPETHEEANVGLDIVAPASAVAPAIESDGEPVSGGVGLGEPSAGSATSRPGDTPYPLDGSSRGMTGAAKFGAAAFPAVALMAALLPMSPSDPLPPNPFADGPCVSAAPTGSAASAASAAAKSTAAKSAAANSAVVKAPSSAPSTPAPTTTGTGAGTNGPAKSEAPTTTPATTKSPAENASTAKPTGTKPPFPCPSQVPVNAKGAVGEQLFPDEPWILKTSLLAMAGMDYKGVVNVKTGSGRVKPVLKFEVSHGVDIWNLDMVSPTEKGQRIHVSSVNNVKSYIKNGTVTFYTESLKGNLFGIFPVEFTPSSPPPLNVPVAFFTKVTVRQAGQTGATLVIPDMTTRVEKP